MIITSKPIFRTAMFLKALTLIFLCIWISKPQMSPLWIVLANVALFFGGLFLEVSTEPKPRKRLPAVLFAIALTIRELLCLVIWLLAAHYTWKEGFVTNLGSGLWVLCAIPVLTLIDTIWTVSEYRKR